MSRTPFIGTLKIPTHEISLHDQKVRMWCAGSGRRIIGPMFLNDIVNLELHVHNIFELFEVLAEEEKQYAYFQQDSTAAAL